MDKYCAIPPLIGGMCYSPIHRERKQNGGCQGLEKGEDDGELALDASFSFAG